jgi:hypothetical protein
VELALGAACCVAVLGFSWRWSRRRPGVPMSWQTSQSVAADLHRRMHRAVDRTRANVAEARTRGDATASYNCLVDDLGASARAFDVQLVLASKLPFRQRDKTVLGLRYRISDMVRSGERVS